MKILYLNHKISSNFCAIHSYGKHLFDIIKNNSDISYVYEEIGNLFDYDQIDKISFNAIIYNWSNCTMNFINILSIQRRLKNIGILHENTDFFDVNLYVSNKINIPRPIPAYNSKKVNNDIITFGSFGFCLPNKGFPNIVKIVNDQYDNAIINFLLIPPYFMNESNNIVNNIINDCKNNNKKENIKLFFYTENITDSSILSFLNSNDMNLFLYDDNNVDIPISSVIDYVLAVKKPFGISNSQSFRHIYTDDICLTKKSIQECMNNSQNLYKKFSNQNKDILSIFKSILFRDFKPNGLVHQDLFVYKILGKIQNGTFLDIGAGNCVDHGNNTLQLAKIGWNGIGFDICKNFEYGWNFVRNQKFICEDVTTIDWNKIICENPIFNQTIDYLSFDVDDATSLAMKHFPWDKIRFKVITIEHDCYRIGDSIKNEQREILKKFGYLLLYVPMFSLNFLEKLKRNFLKIGISI